MKRRQWYGKAEYDKSEKNDVLLLQNCISGYGLFFLCIVYLKVKAQRAGVIVWQLLFYYHNRKESREKKKQKQSKQNKKSKKSYKIKIQNKIQNKFKL